MQKIVGNNNNADDINCSKFNSLSDEDLDFFKFGFIDENGIHILCKEDFFKRYYWKRINDLNINFMENLKRYKNFEEVKDSLNIFFDDKGILKENVSIYMDRTLKELLRGMLKAYY